MSGEVHTSPRLRRRVFRRIFCGCGGRAAGGERAPHWQPLHPRNQASQQCMYGNVPHAGAVIVRSLQRIVLPWLARDEAAEGDRPAARRTARLPPMSCLRPSQMRIATSFRSCYMLAKVVCACALAQRIEVPHCCIDISLLATASADDTFCEALTSNQDERRAMCRTRCPSCCSLYSTLLQSWARHSSSAQTGTHLRLTPDGAATAALSFAPPASH